MKQVVKIAVITAASLIYVTIIIGLIWFIAYGGNEDPNE